MTDRRQEAVDALLGVLNDIGGRQRDNYNVSYEAAAKALDATGLQAEVERLLRRCATLERDVSSNAALAREASSLRAEVDRLRKALERLALMPGSLRTLEAATLAIEVEQIAREALRLAPDEEAQR
jgi:predicted RNase H-like nuclease (RuvC/YqgF family)